MTLDKEISPFLYQWLVRPSWITKKHIHNRLKKRFQFENQTVLDFGSGTGANCTLFSPAGYIGIDPSESRIQYSRKKYKDYLFYTLEDNTIPLENNSADYILMIAVLHHISSEQISHYFNEFKRILKPNGLIVSIEPCCHAKKPISSFLMKKLDKGKYIRDEASYLELFTKQDFECRVLERFRKCFLYNELFFCAHLKK